jgi:hypothetical protein
MAEGNLWCAVIAQAFIDIGVMVPATSGGARAIGDCPQYSEAMRFLRMDDKDFPVLCQLAGVNPAVIRGAAREQRRCIAAAEGKAG